MPHGGCVTISIGVAEGTLPDDAAWRDLYHRADKALYAAKRRGRDRVVHAQDLDTADLPQTPPALPPPHTAQRKVA